jgi:hypothetical protein
MQLADRVWLEYVTLAFADARGGEVGGWRQHRERLAAPGLRDRRQPRPPGFPGPRRAGEPCS